MYNYFSVSSDKWARMLSAIISPSLGGTALPIYLDALVIATYCSSAKNLYVFGNVCIRAASLTDIARSWVGCPNLPFPNPVHWVVIVGAGFSQTILP